MKEIRVILRESLPEIIGGLFVALILAIISLVYTNLGLIGVGLILAAIVILVVLWLTIKQQRFREWLKQMFNRLDIGLKWLIGKWRFIVLYSFVIILGIIMFRTYSDWKIAAFSLVCYVVGLLSWRISNRPILFGRSKSTESKIKFLPIPLLPGVGNAYLKSRYIAPPLGDVVLGGAQFQFKADSLIFDTNEQIHYSLPRNDGRKEIDFQLPKPENQVKSVYFLINSWFGQILIGIEKCGKLSAWQIIST